MTHRAEMIIAISMPNRDAWLKQLAWLRHKGQDWALPVLFQKETEK